MSAHRSTRPDPARGVFETLLVLGGRPVELRAHLARLDSSIRGLYGTPAPHGLRELALDRAEAMALGRLRLTVAPNGEGALAAEARAREVPEAHVFPSWRGAVTLTELVVEGGLGAHKWADRRLLEAAEVDAAVPVIVDVDQTVLEASRANVFVVQDGTIVTPRADGRILPGVTRARVVRVTERLGIPVRAEAVSVDRLLEADEVFLSGSVRGVEPVRSWAGGREWSPGELTPLIADQLRRLWERERRST
jgi:para-aminobenzoate synthetase / 4-amino-4-deoxychorismate lyase